MAEAFDVTIDGHGYMVRAGSYERRQAGIDEARRGRVRLFDFYGGSRRAAQLERDRFWRGLGAWPALDSQGVTAGPKRQDKTETVSPAVAPEVPRWSFAYQGQTYIVQGSHLYRVSTSGGLYAGLESVQALAATVVDADLLGSRIFVAYGPASDIQFYDLAAGTLNNLTNPGQRARLIGHDEENLRYVPAGSVAVVNNEAGDAVATLDGFIRRLVQVDGHLWVLTDVTLWRHSGTADFTAEASMPRLGYSDDAAWAITHFGRLYTWIGKEVVYYDTGDDAFAATGLRGRETLGACAVGSYLVVAIVSDVTGLTELWSWDGRGWYLVDEQTTAETTWSYPVSTFGAADDCDMLAGRGTLNQQTGIWQFFPRSGSPGLRSSYSVETSLLDGGERDVDKAWRRIGVELAWPDSRGTSDQVTVDVDYSTDGGNTWADLTTSSIAGDAGRTHTVSAALASVARSRWLQVRVTVSSIATWAPVVAGIWAEYETYDSEAQKRRWRFAVQCKDAVVKRDGSVDSTGARALAARLWDSWAAGGVVTFRDIDYDLTLTEYTVRIAGIREQIAKPNDAARLADSSVELSLVEV